MLELTEYAPDQITVRDDFNPRSSVDEDRQAELVASIRTMGILQPLVCEVTNGDGPVLVDGHRRLAAAAELRLATVPVLIRSGDVDELAEAIVLNLRRENLNPVDEATGYQRLIDAGRSIPQVADLVGASDQVVRSRLRLLGLSPTIQGRIASGDLPLRAVRRLEDIAEVRPELAEWVAVVVTDPSNKTRPSDLDDHSGFDDVLRYAQDLADENDQPLALVAVPLRAVAGELEEDFPPEAYPDLAAAIATLKSLDSWARVELTEQDVDAARAYGCLLEAPASEHSWGTQAWICDPAFAADRLLLAVQKAASDAEKRRRRDATGSSSTVGADGAPVDAKAARKAKRDEDDKARVSARRENLTVGASLFEHLHGGGPDDLHLDLTRVVCLLLLRDRSTEIRQGPRLVEHTLQDEKTLKNGKAKVTYQPSSSSTAFALHHVTRSATPAEMISRTVQYLLAGWAADQNALTQSEQSWDLRIPAHGMSAAWLRALDAVATAALPDGAARKRVLKELARSMPEDETPTDAPEPDPDDDAGDPED